MVSAGEPLDPETIAAWQEATGLEPADGYGQTETGQVTANLAGEAVRRGSMGKPLPGMEVRIADGELQLRAASSPTFFSRYLDGERFEGEWWPTGDLVTEDDDGFLFFEGRNDDIISSSGYRIGPTEVEAALLSHPAVADAAAVAAPDPGTRQRRPRDRRPPRPRAQRGAGHRAARALPAPRPPPTRRPASSTSSTSCRRRPAARSSAPSCAPKRAAAALGRTLGRFEHFLEPDRGTEVVALRHVDAELAQHRRRLVVLDELGDRRLPRPWAIWTIAWTVSWSASLRACRGRRRRRS